MLFDRFKKRKFEMPVLNKDTFRNKNSHNQNTKAFILKESGYSEDLNIADDVITKFTTDNSLYEIIISNYEIDMLNNFNKKSNRKLCDIKCGIYVIVKENISEKLLKEFKRLNSKLIEIDVEDLNYYINSRYNHDSELMKNILLHNTIE